MTEGLDFIAIDFETATGKRASICEAGICVVKDGKVIELQRFTNTRNVECGIVCNKYRCVRKIFKYL